MNLSALTAFFLWVRELVTPIEELLAKKKRLDYQIHYHANELTKSVNEMTEVLEILASHELRNISDLRVYLGKQDPPP